MTCALCRAATLGSVVLLFGMPAARGQAGQEPPAGKLAVAGPAEVARFGASVSISGDTAVVGAYQDETPGNGRSGAAYVYVRSGSTWTEQQKLVASDAAAGDEFGVAVAIDGDTIVVGARFSDTSSGADAGAAYVFVRSGTTWTEQQKLAAAGAAADNRFGESVAISGDTLAVGAPYTALPGIIGTGAAYVFGRSGTTWSQQYELRAGDPAIGQEFGSFLSISGNTIAVTAPGDDNIRGSNAGAAYVFVLSGTVWVQQQKLLVSGGASNDRLGHVSLSGDTLALSTSVCQARAGNYEGFAYVFLRTGMVWTELQRIEEEPPVFCGFFGSSVALSGDTLAVGAYGSGAVYVFVRAGLTWPLQQKLTPPLSAGSFGWAAALSADTAIVGAPYFGDEGFAGAAYVFTRSGTAWTPQQSLVGVADISLSLTDSPDPVAGLSIFDYQIAVANAGPDESGPVRMRLYLSPMATFQSASGAGWSCTPPSNCPFGTWCMFCTRPTLAVGAAPPITVSVRAPGNFVGEIHASAAVLAGPLDLGGNGDVESTTVTEAPRADLSITKSDGGQVGRWAQPFTWTLVATNNGPAPTTGAIVSDTFPPTVTGVAWTCAASAGASCPASGSGNISAPVTLPSGGTATFNATGTISPGTLTLVNTASVAPPPDVLDPFAPNDSATAISAVEPASFYTVAPCRILDTRTAPPPLDANSTRTVAAAGLCGVPADARAVAVILTAVNPGDLGNLRLYPTGQPAPLASALNFVADRTRANNAIVPLGTGGQIDVRCDMPAGSSATTHFLLDVFGYFR